jgi:uncharacterized protein YkwD
MHAHTDPPVHRIRRRLGTMAAVVAAGAGLPAAAAGATCAGADTIPTAETREGAAAATVCVVNGERSHRHLARLRERPGLGRAGSRYARAMVRDEFFSHTSPTGATMVDRLRSVGYARPDRAWSVGEALAWGVAKRATPAATVAAWMASPPHRRLLLDPAFRDIGIGVVTGVPVARHADGAGATYAAELGVRP